MADQVNPIGSLTPNAPVAPVVQSASAQGARAEAGTPEAARDQVTLTSATVVAEAQPARTSTPSLEEAAKTLRQFLKDLPSDLEFQEDQDTGHLYFKVVNPVTREVIRQVPSEDILAMARKLKELADTGKKAPGVLLDQQG